MRVHAFANRSKHWLPAEYTALAVYLQHFQLRLQLGEPNEMWNLYALRIAVRGRMREKASDLELDAVVGRRVLDLQTSIVHSTSPTSTHRPSATSLTAHGDKLRPHYIG